MYELKGSDYKAVLDLATSLVHVKSISAFSEMLINAKQQLGFASVTMLELIFHKTCTHNLIFSDSAHMNGIDDFTVSQEHYDRDAVFPQILAGKEVVKVCYPPEFIKDIIDSRNGAAASIEESDVCRHILNRFNKETNTANLIIFTSSDILSSQKFDAMAGYLHVHLMSAFVRIMSARERLDEKLSERELSVLTWLKYGKTSWEVAKILNITENTVNFHIKNIKRKLNATNRQHAVAIALAKGLME